MVRLLFRGEDQLRYVDPQKLLDRVRAKYPRLKEHEALEVARAMVEQDQQRHAPRYPGLIKMLLGWDVGADDVTTIPAWMWLSQTERERLGRETVAERLARVWPDGLSRTYVWRKETGWTQDVTDADVEVIRRSAARHWFVRADKNWRPVRTFDFPVIDRQVFGDALEAKRYEQSLMRTPQWRGY